MEVSRGVSADAGGCRQQIGVNDKVMPRPHHTDAVRDDTVDS